MDIFSASIGKKSLYCSFQLLRTIQSFFLYKYVKTSRNSIYLAVSHFEIRTTKLLKRSFVFIFLHISQFLFTSVVRVFQRNDLLHAICDIVLSILLLSSLQQQVAFVFLFVFTMQHKACVLENYVFLILQFIDLCFQMQVHVHLNCLSYQIPVFIGRIL